MRKQQTHKAVVFAAALFTLILDGRTALEGANEGMELCIRTLIPSLFPFLFLTAMLTEFLPGQSLVIIGFLGGYPAGAQNVARAWRSGTLSKESAEYLLPLCNQPGPAFLFGILGPMFSEKWVPWLLWGVQIAATLTHYTLIPHKNAPVPSRTGSAAGFVITLNQTLRVMGTICGWVILFRILLAFFDNWFLWLLPKELQILTAGILELSNGCIQLNSISSEGHRFTMAAVLLSLGGLCVTMQTASVAAGLSMKRYCTAKLLQGILCFLLCQVLQFLFPGESRWFCPLWIPGISLVIFLILLRRLKRNKKISSIPATIGV